MNISLDEHLRAALQSEIESLVGWQKVANKHGLRITTQYALAELLAILRRDAVLAEELYSAMQRAGQIGEDIQDALEHSELERALIGLKQIHGDDFEAAWQHLAEGEV